MYKNIAKAGKLMTKTAIVTLAVLSLVASGITGGGGGDGGGGDGGGGDGGGGDGGGTGNGDPVVVGSPLILVNPDAAKGTYSESSGYKNVAANLTFRANSAFFNNGSYVKVQGHELKAAYGKSETSSNNVASAYTKNAGAFTGILSSATQFITLDEAAKTLSGAEITQLNNLRTDIANIGTKPTLAQQAVLKTKLEELAALISYGGLQVSLRSLPSGNGFYGLFANNDSGDFKQLSGVYAFADGKSLANYGTVQGGGGTNVYHSKFNGAAAISGIQFIGLKGDGDVTANFATQQLSASFAVSNEDNNETGTITFNGGMSANVDGKTGLIFNTNGAAYAKTSGQLGDMTGGIAEATLVQDGNSILGSVNITSGGNAVVGGFGGDK